MRKRLVINIIVLILGITIIIAAGEKGFFIDNSNGDHVISLYNNGSLYAINSYIGNMSADYYCNDTSCYEIADFLLDTTGEANDGLFLNYTPITTTGNITNGSLKGYPAANNICDFYYDGSHMCTIDEILNTINQNVSNTNFTATFWASEGAPGYLANANDCDGWTSQTGTYLGSIFVGSTSHLNTYGSGSLVTCSASRAIGCCK